MWIHPGKLTWNPKNGGLEDHFPIQLGDVLAVNFAGVYSLMTARSLSFRSISLATQASRVSSSCGLQEVPNATMESPGYICRFE